MILNLCIFADKKKENQWKQNKTNSLKLPTSFIQLTEKRDTL